MNPDFWKGKRVFLTGHTGFKGSWMTLLLKRLGADVAGYSLEPATDPNLFTIAGLERDCAPHHIADIRDRARLAAAVRDFAPHIVFHMAAQPLVRLSYSEPVETYDTNVMGTVHLLDAVRDLGTVKATVIITSDKCYENRETIWAYREGDAMGGHDPYSSSKGCAELVTAAYGRSYFQPAMGRGSVASVRAGNVIGGGDWAKDRLLADIARGLVGGDRITIRCPDAIRPWQHVLEPLHGYLAVAERLVVGGPVPWEAWNFGPDSASEQNVQALATLACAYWGRPDLLSIEPDPNAVHEATLLKLDSTKAHTYLHWAPKWGFKETVRQTIDWYKLYAERGDMRSYTLSQIESYASAGG